MVVAAALEVSHRLGLGSPHLSTGSGRSRPAPDRRLGSAILGLALDVWRRSPILRPYESLRHEQ